MIETRDVDSYIDGAPVGAQPTLRELRRLVFDAVPSATERISYGMPTYELDGRRLLHFGAAKRHVGVYGLVHVDSATPEALAAYLDHRSTLRFGFGGTLPTDALREAIHDKLRVLYDEANPRPR